MTSIARSLACCLMAVSAVAVSNSRLSAQAFILRPGDAVRVFVPRDTGLSGTFDVDLASVLTVPLVGRVDVTGRPWNQVNAQLMAAYRRELREPGITVTPLRRVIVLGAVSKPGTYLLEPTMTLSSALAVASGAVTDGSLRRITIQRGDSTLKAFAPKGGQIVDVPLESGDRIFVLRRGWVQRNGNLLASAILSLTGIVVTLARR